MGRDMGTCRGEGLGGLFDPLRLGFKRVSFGLYGRYSVDGCL